MSDDELSPEDANRIADAIEDIERNVTRLREDYLHRVSNALVQEALAHGCTHIAFENLKNIRERISNVSKFQQWAFRRIQEYTEYKAAEYGRAVETVAPQYTSQRCSHVDCSFTHEDNRDGDEFCCLKCDREYHADYNAVARNRRFLAARQT